MKSLVWIVEDAALVRLLIEEILSENDFIVRSFRSARQAISSLGEGHAIPSILITDISFDGDQTTGWDVARFVHKVSPDILTIYISGYFDSDDPVEAIPPGIFLRKPFTGKQLISAISDARGKSSPPDRSTGTFPIG
ncbi:MULTISPECIES: response regulator [unclassified Sphingomonas]|uniref:response regulator n=1 Tax=unclassified Sphingomonas TaxID=196159 RepID=UPI000701B9D5|nr:MULTISPECIES: response regulator [unclassified Sphingomonas]KQX26158.1 hypothetical protein ASD17_01475 [Sphingomonas sp. Root1294]KQY69225.1 hypothetical protein ASD39_02670 [Sphingomonas sp. Root50]KRB89481.1 hypothetical protein ASE22_17585 [Sphingomonas sp. Root720]